MRRLSLRSIIYQIIFFIKFTAASKKSKSDRVRQAVCNRNPAVSTTITKLTRKESRFSQSDGEIHCREPSPLVHPKNATSSMISRSSSSPLSSCAVASAERRSSRRFSAGNALSAHSGTAFSVWISHGTLHSGITSSA